MSKELIVIRMTGEDTSSIRTAGLDHETIVNLLKGHLESIQDWDADEYNEMLNANTGNSMMCEDCGRSIDIDNEEVHITDGELIVCVDCITVD